MTYTATATVNRYRVNWKGHPQPLGGITFESAKAYIQHSLRLGGCNLSEFEIFDNYGQLKTSIINDKTADPTLTKNYIKLYK